VLDGCMLCGMIRKPSLVILRLLPMTQRLKIVLTDTAFALWMGLFVRCTDGN
jgi:hypothetical protein